MNRKMKDLFDAGIANDATVVPPELARMVDDGFEIIEGCVVFSGLAKRMTTTKSSDFPDRTGRECFVNHVHVERAASAFAFAKRLQEALRSRGEHFIIIVSSDAESCSVRFHKARDGESWLADDLDAYGDEALLVLDVDSSQMDRLTSFAVYLESSRPGNRAAKVRLRVRGTWRRPRQSRISARRTIANATDTTDGCRRTGGIPRASHGNRRHDE